ncbi:hypothetical protein BDR07DRAFT_1409293 [Suillus spraguei]|nr:hypothetical protein BDR07DRAFT_1409293 [Suillus spraguei]
MTAVSSDLAFAVLLFILVRCFVTRSNYCCMHAASDTDLPGVHSLVAFVLPSIQSSPPVLSSTVSPFFTAM